MDMNQTIPPHALAGAEEAEPTRPPLSAMRFDTPADLYAAIPQIAELTQMRPGVGEDPLAFMLRLRGSQTPEEAVTFTAFAAVPQMAIWWGHECLRLMRDTMSPADVEMMEQVGHWINDPSNSNRHRIMRKALFAEMRSPSIRLGLAVGWSGGSIAPNDPAPVPIHRAPKSVNSAILSALAQAPLSRRAEMLSKITDMAESLFRVY